MRMSGGEAALTPLALPPNRISDAVYEAIARLIVSGEYAEGSRLRDADIADELGVSRMPVREAMKRLELEGLVEMSASRYTRVTVVGPELAQAAWDVTALDLGIALGLAAGRLDDAERSALVRLVEALAVSLGHGGSAVADALLPLLDAATAQSANPVLAAAWRGQRNARVRALRRARPPLRPEDVPARAGAVVSALEAQDGPGAERAVRALLLPR